MRAPSGELFSLHRPIVLGRTPRTPLGPFDRVLLLTWPGEDREVSATHVMLEQVETRVVITDLGSANGTRVRVPGQQPRRLAPHETFTASGEATVEFGHSGRIMVIPARSAPSA
ncbi:MAG: FHA domain-containing protein [Actinobacteria bacterium]|nr:FHA domain-containing protein [Actinomycetota bacterium]